jgi:hypothetical protein
VIEGWSAAFQRDLALFFQSYPNGHQWIAKKWYWLQVVPVGAERREWLD